MPKWNDDDALLRAVASGLLLVLWAGSARGLAQETYDLSSKETVQRRLDGYKGDDTKREGVLKELFREAGCGGDHLTEQAVRTRKQPNVICVLPGSTADVIVVGGHFDHVVEGNGIVDNWSGASLLPSLYEALARVPRKHTYVFLGFTGEEAGLVGSEFYVNNLSPEEIGKIEVMVNLDTLGLGPTKVWVKQSDPLLLGVLWKVSEKVKAPLASMEIGTLGESDEESFIGRGVCTVVVHSLTGETVHVLHTRADNPQAIRFADLYETYRLLAAYLAVLDTLAIPEPHVCTTQPVAMYRGGRVRRGEAAGKGR